MAACVITGSREMNEGGPEWAAFVGLSEIALPGLVQRLPRALTGGESSIESHPRLSAVTTA